ncbi:MAG: aminotransferase class I/II-fold pyridoxal phosphate-dependent enzyme [Syntrophorhabdaceae bacterium]
MKRDIPDIYDFALRASISLRRIMDFTTAANPVGPSEKTKAAIRKSLKVIDRPNDRHAGYLVRAIAQSYRIAEENILVCDRFDALMAGILRIRGVRDVLCTSPYPAYYRELMELPLDISFFCLDAGDDYSLNRQEWQKQLHKHGAAVISYPSFISRTIPSRDDILRMIEIAREKNILLIIDETLIRYSDAPSFSEEAAGCPDCLVVNSLTEYYALAGLPAAFCSGSAETIRRLKDSGDFFVPPTIALAAATHALRDKEYPAQTRTFFRNEAAFIEQNLEKIPGVTYFKTGCGFYVVRCNNPPAGSLELFRHYRILVDDISSSGTIFFPVKDHKWNARYIKTLKNIMGALK